MIYKVRLNEQVYGNNQGNILTLELADYIQQNSCVKTDDLAEQLGFSKDVLIRFRRELNIQRKKQKSDYEWVYAHQEELFNESFETLFEKYGLTKKQVIWYVTYLKRHKGTTGPLKRRPLNKFVERENFFTA